MTGLLTPHSAGSWVAVGKFILVHRNCRFQAFGEVNSRRRSGRHRDLPVCPAQAGVRPARAWRCGRVLPVLGARPRQTNDVARWQRSRCVFGGCRNSVVRYTCRAES